MSDRQPPRWQFWIDVGGTFTDCVARDPRGNQHRAKVLSSSTYKGKVGRGSTPNAIFCEALSSRAHSSRRRSADTYFPDDFWNGSKIRLIQGGLELGTSVVTDFDSVSGRLAVEELSQLDQFSGDVSADLNFEIRPSVVAPLLAIHKILGIPIEHDLPALDLRLGTTKGTNALLTRSGSRTALVTTEGFGDLLEIGNQTRPHLFDLNIQKIKPLCETTIEITERLAADGSPIQSPCVETAKAQLKKLYEDGIESVAICFLHSYKNLIHEKIVAEIATSIGFKEVCQSSLVSPLIKFLSRAQTTVLDAYLNPVLQDYLHQIAAKLDPNSTLEIIDSAGGIVNREDFSGKDSILSGPAGGVVGFSSTAAIAGFDRSIGFDMGGTSTDVSRFDGKFEFEFETEKSGVQVMTPMMAIETVAAGGGSICKFDGAKLVVGPQSAGSDPGPRCYGRGGPITVTDINFFLGRISADQFPFPLDLNAVNEGISQLTQQINAANENQLSEQEVALGFLEIANASMGLAIRKISVAKGYDPSEYCLVAFGGAAPQHACQVAQTLNIQSILIHPNAGIMSALGIGMAKKSRHSARGIYKLTENLGEDDIAVCFGDLSSICLSKLSVDDVDSVQFEKSLELRFENTDTAIRVGYQDLSTSISEFTEAHLRQFGYLQDRPIEVVSARLLASIENSETLHPSQRLEHNSVQPDSKIEFVSSGKKVSGFSINRADLNPGDELIGPGIIFEDFSTIVLDTDWRAEILSDGQILMQHLSKSSESDSALKEKISLASSDPILLELFNNNFAAIASEMGDVLQKTSISVNVKERLDFSCAIFDQSGDLVVNAPHIPVHLGAMSETIKHLMQSHSIAMGDVYVTNNPFQGGSHLPDVTVVSPVFDERGEELRFFVASRAHHAEIGGQTPGSMPPNSTCLADEGVLITFFKLIESGEQRFDGLEEILNSGRYPSRDPATNLADIKAQIAANVQGIQQLNRLVENYGWTTVRAYMKFIQAAAEAKTRIAIEQFPNQTYRFSDQMDNGAKIVLQTTIDRSDAHFDFTGTSGVQPTNINANRAIVKAAILYCLRCLINEDIPLNEGVLAPIKVTLPNSFLNPPASDDAEKCAAVACGNVETSQRIVDVIFGALGIAAASQGTMNNLLFGDSTFGYYETICGGAGATPDADGASAVHTHMTNTLMTDAEILETRFPVRLREFRVRKGSGGKGKTNGGDGIIRRIEFLKPLQVTILSNRRTELPFGLEGGDPGQAGRNQVIKTADQKAEQSVDSQTTESLNSSATLESLQGQVIIQTPGGGGIGQAKD